MRKYFILLIILFLLMTSGCFKAADKKNDADKEKEAVLTAAWKESPLQSIVIPGEHNESIPGILLLPVDVRGRCPAILAIHGLTDRKESWIDHTGYAKGGEVSSALLKQGFVVFAIDLPYHGKRILPEQKDRQKELVWNNRDSFFENAVKDIRHAVDFLTGNTIIDPEKIGLIGYSLGGMIAYSVANSDPRIRCLVTCVAPPDRGREYKAAPARNLNNITGIPVLIIAATRDENYTIEDAQWLFDRIPSPVKEFAPYESGHSLPAEYAQQAAGWFVKYLGSAAEKQKSRY